MRCLRTLANFTDFKCPIHAPLMTQPSNRTIILPHIVDRVCSDTQHPNPSASLLNERHYSDNDLMLNTFMRHSERLSVRFLLDSQGLMGL